MDRRTQPKDGNLSYMSFVNRFISGSVLSHSQRRLDNALTRASVVDFDDHSRLVFFSDLHRGDNGPADAFRCNQSIFLSALGHYERQGYTYVEVGDGDELWKNSSLAKVQSAHRPVYRIMERLKSAGRLMVLVGNHQLVRHGCKLATAGPEAVEAILLEAPRPRGSVPGHPRPSGGRPACPGLWTDSPGGSPPVAPSAKPRVTHRTARAG